MADFHFSFDAGISVILSKLADADSQIIITKTHMIPTARWVYLDNPREHRGTCMYDSKEMKFYGMHQQSWIKAFQEALNEGQGNRDIIIEKLDEQDLEEEVMQNLEEQRLMEFPPERESQPNELDLLTEEEWQHRVRTAGTTAELEELQASVRNLSI